MSDLLLGYPSFTLQSKSDNTLRLRTDGVRPAYAQDDWKLGPDVTVNLGVRYKYNTPRHRSDQPHVGVQPRHRDGRARGHGRRVGPPASRPTTTTSRRGSASRGSCAPALVVRGGYGLYYDAGMFEVNSAMYFNPPQFTLQGVLPDADLAADPQQPVPDQRRFRAAGLDQHARARTW